MDIPDIHTLWHDLHAAVTQTLATNQFAQGGVLSAAAVFARSLPGQFWNWLLSRYTVTLDVQGEAVRRDGGALTGHGCPTRLKLLAG